MRFFILFVIFTAAIGGFCAPVPGFGRLERRQPSDADPTSRSSSLVSQNSHGESSAPKTPPKHAFRRFISWLSSSPPDPSTRSKLASPLSSGSQLSGTYAITSKWTSVFSPRPKLNPPQAQQGPSSSKLDPPQAQQGPSSSKLNPPQAQQEPSSSKLNPLGSRFSVSTLSPTPSLTPSLPKSPTSIMTNFATKSLTSLQKIIPSSVQGLRAPMDGDDG